MAPVQSRVEAHERDVARYAKFLQKARDDAHMQRQYDSASTRAQLRTEFRTYNNGMEAYTWQVDVAEALHLGLDCTVIAGTGAGKTLPFVMPLFLEKDKIVVIISPLNALEEDQASRFRNMGLSAVAVNGDTFDSKLRKELEELKHRVVLTSPEMCLEHDQFRKILGAPKFSAKIAAFVVDKAHCISQWGEQFRQEYSRLGTLRALVKAKVPILAASATLPPSALAQVRKTMLINANMSYHVNVGTDRPNLAWFVQHMKGAKTDLQALAFLIPPHAPNSEVVELLQTMVFFDDINLSMEAVKWLQNLLPEHMHSHIACYNSRRSRQSKEKVLAGFREGRIKILLTTKAAGMGCDIPNIEQVVQFMVPSSLSIWMQRSGRAGRNALLNARVILLVQPSIFQEVNIKEGEERIGDTPKYRKEVKEGLREWFETTGCRRDVADEYFYSGNSRQAPTGVCCDNCLRKAQLDHPLLAARLTTSTTAVPSTTTSIVETSMLASGSGSPTSDDEDAVAPSQDVGCNGKRPMAAGVPTAIRRDKHLQAARDVLTDWQRDTYLLLYSRRPWGLQALLPDKTLTAIASKARLQTIDDLVGVGWGKTHASRHGKEVLDLLIILDIEANEEREAEKVRNAMKRKVETAQRRAAKAAEGKANREAQRAERARQPKQRRSRAKALGSSSAQNTYPAHPGLASHTTRTGKENAEAWLMDDAWEPPLPTTDTFIPPVERPQFNMRVDDDWVPPPPTSNTFLPQAGTSQFNMSIDGTDTWVSPPHTTDTFFPRAEPPRFNMSIDDAWVPPPPTVDTFFPQAESSHTNSAPPPRASVDPFHLHTVPSHSTAPMTELPAAPHFGTPLSMRWEHQPQYTYTPHATSRMWTSPSPAATISNLLPATPVRNPTLTPKTPGGNAFYHIYHPQLRHSTPTVAASHEMTSAFATPSPFYHQPMTPGVTPNHVLPLRPSGYVWPPPLFHNYIPLPTTSRARARDDAAIPLSYNCDPSLP